MQHKISEFCDKVSVMYEKSMLLRRLKYDTPKDKQDEVIIRALMEDIQALALDIAYDRTPHAKIQK
jgi:hypothetical protein